MPAALTDDGISISYEVAGEGPPSLLFMHGWAGSGRYFDAMIEHLDLVAPARRHVRPARPPRSPIRPTTATRSTRPPPTRWPSPTPPALDEFLVVGFSMSARFAQYLALVAPERVLGLILVAGCPTGEIPLPAELTDDWFGREGDAQRLTELATAYATNPIEPELLERFGEDAATVRRVALEGTLHAAIATSFTDRVGSIATPTLVVGGLHDAMFPPDLLRDAVVAPLPSARLELLDAGHEIPIELPSQLAALVEAFVAERAPEAARAT